MSAFLVSDDHITAICTFACDSRTSGVRVWLNGQPERASGRHMEAFQMLKQANIDSLTARYGDPQQTAEAKLGRLKLPPLAIVKACDCLAYQCSEVENWKDTDAAKTLEEIKYAAVAAIPGYDEEAWEIEAGTADYGRRPFVNA